jgi:hypothetical protein
MTIAGVPFEDARYPIDPITFKKVEWDGDKDQYPFKKIVSALARL